MRLDDDFYDWLMSAYENNELNLEQIENACKDRWEARRLWEEFTFGNDEIDYAMEVIAHVRTGIKEKVEKYKKNQTCRFCEDPSSILTKETCCSGCSKFTNKEKAD